MTPGTWLIGLTTLSRVFETLTSSASQEIPRILWNLKVHHKCPPPVPILSQMNPIYATYPTSWRSFVISSHLCLGLPSGLFPSCFPTKTLYAPLPNPLTCYMPNPSDSSRCDHLNLVRSRDHKLFPFPVIWSLLGPNVLLSSYSQTPSACVPPSTWATKFHAHTEEWEKL